MTHSDAGRYSAKHAPGGSPDQRIAGAVREKAVKGALSCAEAERIGATAKVAKVTGMRLASPPILVMSCSPCRAWITLPDPRNRQALKKAWVTTWKIATA